MGLSCAVCVPFFVCELGFLGKGDSRCWCVIGFWGFVYSLWFVLYVRGVLVGVFSFGSVCCLFAFVRFVGGLVY